MYYKTSFSNRIAIEAEEAFNLQIAICDQNQLARGWNCLGGLFQEQGKLEDAQDAFKQNIKILELLEDKLSLSIVLNRLAGILQQQGKLEEVEKVFMQQIEILELLEDKSSLSIVLNRLGGILQQQGKLEEAEKVFVQQIEILELLEDKLSLSITLNRLGGILQQQGKLEEAENTFKQNIKALELLEDKSFLSITLNRLGIILQQQGKSEEAENIFENQIKIAIALDDQNKIARGLYCLSKLFQEQGYLTNAIISARLCVCAETEAGASKNLCIALLQVSQLLKIAGQIPEAIIILRRIAQIEEELGNKWGVTKTLNSIASLQRDQGHFDEAIETFLCILEIEQNLNDQEGISWALASLGYAALQQKNFSVAIKYYNEAVKISKECNDADILISTLNGMQKALYQYGNYLSRHHNFVDETHFLLIESQEILFSINMCTQVATTLHSLGKVWKLKGNLVKAVIVLECSKTFFEDEENSDEELVKILCILGKILQKQQNWVKAEEMFRQGCDLNFKLNDKKGQATIMNDLGQLIYKKKGENNLNNSQMYFTQSIKLGEELKDREHVAKVYTARGQAFLYHKKFDQAFDDLLQGFEIDESLGNIHGLRITIKSLMCALENLGRKEEIVVYQNRIIRLDQNYHDSTGLYDPDQITIQVDSQNCFIKIGSILHISHNKDNSLWGQIVPNDGTAKITFNENFVDLKSMSMLAQNDLVEVEAKEKNGRFYATKIRLVESSENN